MSRGIQSEFYTDNDKLITVTGKEEVSIEEYEFWGRTVKEEHVDIVWFSAYNNEDKIEIEITEEIKTLAENCGYEYID